MQDCVILSNAMLGVWMRGQYDLEEDFMMAIHTK